MSIRLGRELLESTILDNLSLVHDHDPVALLDSGHAMCDDDRCATLHGTVQGLLHNLLTLFIESRSCLVQDEDLRVFDESASDSHSLLLSTGKLRAFETANLFEARVERLLLLSDLLHIDEVFQLDAIFFLHALTTVTADIVLEVLYFSARQE